MTEQSPLSQLLPQEDRGRSRSNLKIKPFVAALALSALSGCSQPAYEGWYVVSANVSDERLWSSASFIDTSRIQRLEGDVRRAWVESHWDQWGDQYVVTLYEFDCAGGTLREVQTQVYDERGNPMDSWAAGAPSYAIPETRGERWHRFVCIGPSAVIEASPIGRGTTPAQYVREFKDELVRETDG